ncbi:hypothetical protein TIFTF001_038980 [Ficus carica]|uniref:Uncharacterized protein n=1 Tax=Ficus carica TaxID=3494 RepID=A0AA88JAI3_FICCA|nr:hypothetical protein TIFTF001_038980 [Ficus carica]
MVLGVTRQITHLLEIAIQRRKRDYLFGTSCAPGVRLANEGLLSSGSQLSVGLHEL